MKGFSSLKTIVGAAEEAGQAEACLALAARDFERGPSLAISERLASERLDALLDGLDDERAPAASPQGAAGASRPTAPGFGVVLVDLAGEAIVASVGAGAPSPLLALRSNRPWLLLAGGASAATALRLLVRRADRGLAAGEALEGLDSSGVALLLSDDVNVFGSPLGDTGLAAFGEAQGSAENTSAQV